MATFQCKACQGTYSDTQQDGTTYFHACAPLSPDENLNQAERPNRRDENIALRRPGSPLGIKAEGLGVKDLGKAKLQEPAWITQLKTIAAKAEQES